MDLTEQQELIPILAVINSSVDYWYLSLKVSQFRQALFRNIY
ncbi:hypothetical protein [Scytonema hofmannii]|nr:hypothetical protein [Scytonema hofmannii]